MRASLIALAVVVSISCTRDAGRGTPDAAATSGVAPTTSSVAPAADLRNAAPDTPVQAEFRHVDLHLDADTILQIRALRGELVSLRRGLPPIFDDRGSFILRIHSAEMIMDPPSLSRLMNRFVLGYDGAPLKDLETGVEKGLLTMKGKVHKGIDLPFSMKAEVGVTPEGQIRLHTASFKAAGVPAKRLLDLVGVELDDMVKMRRDRGMQMVDDDVLLDPERLLPPPAIRGTVIAARVSAEGLQLVFGGDSAKTPKLTIPLRSARNFMYYRGGVLRFGKLTMSDADLLLLDDDPRNPFDFFQDHYDDQLVAGYSKNTRAKGLIVHMPDYRTVAGRR